jgi:predicted acylesterase/phospholipase RssA
LTKAPKVTSTIVCLCLFFVEYAQAQIITSQFSGRAATKTLINGTVQVNPGTWIETSFELPPGVQNTLVEGEVVANGGTGNDIRVVVLSELQRRDWPRSSQYFFDSGKQHAFQLRVPIQNAGRYFVLLDNSFSILSAKSVAARIDVVVSNRPTTNLLKPCNTALVLSIGDLKGLAHIGAIEALKESGKRIDCVYGNSMGALIGSLYATNPNENLKTRYQELMAQYVRETTREKTAAAGVFAAVVAVASGGATAVLGAALAGNALVGKIDPNRFRANLNALYGGALIETLPVPYATSYQMKSENGLDLHIASQGNLAEAVSRSINNPYIFTNTNLDYLDPGSDRSAAIPVEDACTRFHPSNIIAINVTGYPVFVSRNMNCNFQEITINPGKDIPRDAMLGVGPDFERVYEMGHDAITSAFR